MKATGIVRRIDDLGRVVIPKEIRMRLHIEVGDPLEIFTTDNGVCFEPCLPYLQPWRLLEDAAKTIETNEDYEQFAAEIRALAKRMEEAKGQA